MSLFFACTTTWLTAELHAVRKQGSFAKGFRNELGEFSILPLAEMFLDIWEMTDPDIDG